MISEWVEYLTVTLDVKGTTGEFFAAAFTVAAIVIGGVIGAMVAFMEGNPLSAIGGSLVGVATLWPATIAHIWFFIQWRKGQ